MSNGPCDKPLTEGDPVEGLAAVKPAPDHGPGASVDQHTAGGRATDEEINSSRDNEISDEPPATRPDDLNTTSSGDGVGARDNADTTWDPPQRTPIDDGEILGDEPAESAEPPCGRQGTGTNPDATYVPTETHSVEDVWGSDFDNVEPEHPLKAPSDPGALPDFFDLDGASAAIPDLSAEGYDLLEVLGEGGVGVVYQAIQKSIDRRIAVKMAKPGVVQDTLEKEKFVSEALVTGRLDHPNIVPIHDLGATAAGQPFYAMKMVRGIPWGDVIQDKPEAENLQILRDVCDAVAFAHSRNVIHRDLKPDNVMLGEFGEVQVLDWGLAASVSSAGDLADPSVTQPAGGTPSYMAPEMVTGEDGPVGIHSDIYLLGAILHQISSGKPPHMGKRVLDVLENARNNLIEPAEHPSILGEIALKAMQKEPADRYASVNDFKQALLDYQTHADSINLCQRAGADLRRADENQDYEAFAEALFGFREALELWSGNTDAQAGVVDAQLRYARCALEKSDLDLAASTLDPNCSEHQALLGEIGTAQRACNASKRRLRVFRVTVIFLTVAVIAILTVASIWIYAAKRQAVTAKEEAIAAKETAILAGEAEAEQRELAENAKTRAQQEEARAVKALTDLEQAYTDLVEARKQEERARAQARESELAATETRDELAKTGMLLDNSWWVSDATAARKAQEDAAATIGTPRELTLKLAGDTDLVMTLIPPGDLAMGSPPSEENRGADEHLHRVHHSKPFYLGTFELTEAQWSTVTGKPPASAAERDVDPALPVTKVSFEHIIKDLLPPLQEYAPQGYEFRLPTEAEWEYACRAGTGTAYSSGDDEDALDSVGWFMANSGHVVQPVGRKMPNAFGLHDMHGNVSEICGDQHVPGFYLESPVNDPVSTGEGDRFVLRGGSVLNTTDHCRSAQRSYIYRRNEYSFAGLRLALVPIRNAVFHEAQDTAAEIPNGP